MGIVIVDDDIEIDQEKINEEKGIEKIISLIKKTI